MPPDAAKEKIAESYNNILSPSSSEDLLRNEHGLNTISEKMLEYYSKRDEDTAECIKRLAKNNNGTMLYICNVTHFNPNYPHLEFLLNDSGFETEIVPVY